MAATPNFVAIDTESTGLNPWRGDRMFAVGMWWPNGTTKFWRGSFEGLREILEDASIDKVFANPIFDMRMLEYSGFQVKGKVWDVLILAHLLCGRDAENISLDFIANKYLPAAFKKVTTEIDDWFKENKYTKATLDFSKLPHELLRRRNIGDAELTGLFFKRAFPTVSTIFPWLLDNEHKLLHVVKKACDRGILVSQEEIHRQFDYFNEMVEEVTDWFEKYTGRHYFSLTGRGDQIRAVEQAGIYDLLIDMDPDKKKERLYLDDYHLRNTHHPVAHMLLVGKAALKMRDTFLDQMERLSVDNILHPNLKQIGTGTGRFSCAQPNLQNIPIDGDRRTAYTEDEAQEMIDMTGFNYAPHIKRIFHVRPGYAHLHSDKKQAEMVMLAHYTNDAGMIEIFNKGESIHDGICRLLYGEWTKGLKTRTKAVVFGYQYGAGLPTIARKIGGTLDDAREAKSRLERILPTLPRWRRELNEKLASNGYVQTIHGRRHYLFGSESYKSVNYMCQGSVGDEIKNRMVAIDDYLVSNNIDGRVLLNIHDDVATEFPAAEYAAHIPNIYRIMNEASMKYNLPLPSSCDVTYTRWSDLKPIEDFTNLTQYSPEAILPDALKAISEELISVHAKEKVTA